MSKSYKFSVELDAEIKDGRVIRDEDNEPLFDGLILIGERSEVDDDLYGQDWIDCIDGQDGTPTSPDTYHVYITGYYWFEETNNTNGHDWDIEVEIDSVEYFSE